MRHWQKLIKNASKSQGLGQASTVAAVVYEAMSPSERRETLLTLLTEAAEHEIRANVRYTEKNSETLARISQSAEDLRHALEQRHGREFSSLAEANDHDDLVWREAIRAKREQQDDRRVRLFAELTARVEMDWTENLLRQEFALGDGTVTTWAAATIEQHEQRTEMLARNITGNGDALKRHDAAVMAIMEAHADSLADALDTGVKSCV